MKSSLGNLVEAISGFTPDIVANIKEFMTFARDNSVLIAGAIAGALTPAFVGLAIAVGTNIALLAPYVAAGALLALTIKEIIERLGGWEVVQLRVTEAVTFLGSVFNEFLGPAFSDLINIIKNQLLPELKEFWTLVSPILIPAIKLFTLVIAGAALGISRLAVEMIKGLVSITKDVIAGFNELIKFFQGLPAAIGNALSGVGEAIAKPFREAKAKVDEIANNIRDSLDKINPYHRESPSLVDNVMSGVQDIKNEFAQLANLRIPPVTGAIEMPQVDTSRLPSVSMGQQSGGMQNSQQITVNIGQVNDNQDIDMISREIAFKAALLPAQ